MDEKPRKIMDCRRIPSDIGCTVTIAGTEDEVVPLAIQHAITAHGEEDTPELRKMIREHLEDEAPRAMRPTPAPIVEPRGARASAS